MSEIKDTIFGIGVKDWQIRRFHGEEYSRTGVLHNLKECEAFGEAFAEKMRA